MSVLSERLALRERMFYEENVRLNREAAWNRKRATGAWETFKSQFRSECREVNGQVVTTQLEVDEQDQTSFFILRKRPASLRAVPVQSFTLDSQIPCISWMNLETRKPATLIEIASDGCGTSFILDGKPIVLANFVADILESVWP